MTENLRIGEPGSEHDLDEYDWLYWFAGKPNDCHRFSPPTRRHAERSEASALALVTTQAQSKSATDSPRQRAVMLSAAKHLQLLLSQLRRNPNPSQILLANALSC